MKIVVSSKDFEQILNVESRPRAKTIKVVFRNDSERNSLMLKELEKELENELNTLVKEENNEIDMKQLSFLAKTLQIETVDECINLIIEYKYFNFISKIKTTTEYAEHCISFWGCNLHEDDCIDLFGDEMGYLNNVFYTKHGCFEYLGDSDRFTDHIDNYNIANKLPQYY